MSKIKDGKKLIRVGDLQRWLLDGFTECEGCTVRPCSYHDIPYEACPIWAKLDDDPQGVS